MFESIFDLLSDAPLAYLILFGVAAGDAVFPALPSESAVILGGVLSVVGDLHLGLVIAAGGLGALVGDNTSYAIGRYGGGALQRRFFDGDRTRSTMRWARDQLDKRGGTLVIAARFVPGGRTATTLTCGLTRFPYPTFFGYTVVAATLWALYGALLGYFGGRVFHDRPLLAITVALALAAGITLLVEGIRRVRSSRGGA